MIDLYVYQFDKRTNSTSIPADNTGYLIENVKLKENTSLLYPIFIVNANTISVDSNYIKMEREGYKTRYYFIDDIFMCVGNIAEVRCTQDHLATWKSEIGNSTQYVTRAYSKSTPLLTDNTIGVTNESIIYNNTLQNKPFVYSQTRGVSPVLQGFYVVGVASLYTCIIRDGQPNHSITISNNIGRSGDVDYFALTYEQMDTFMNSLGAEITNTEGYFRRLVNVKFFPVSQYYLAGTDEGLIVLGGGLGSVHITYSIVDNNLLNAFTLKLGYSSDRYVYAANFSEHPQIDTNIKYLNYSPFAQYTLFCGEFGVIDIDRSMFPDGVYMTFDIDILTGNAYMNLHKTNPHNNFTTSIKLINASIAIDVLWGRGYVDIASAIANTGGTMLSLAKDIATNNTFGALGDILSAKTVPAELYTKGGIGSFLYSNYNWKLQCIFKSGVGFDAENSGYQLNSVQQINTLTGYIRCSNSDIHLPATSTEIEAIKSYMNTGFFYN